MSLRHISRGWWQTFSWSTTQYEEEDIQYRSWEERRAGESHIHPDVSQWPQRHHRTEICHRSWAPSTPTIDIHKNPTPLSFSFFFFFFNLHPKISINGSNKNTINNTNKITARHEESITNQMRVSQWGLMGSAVHGTCSRQAAKCFPELLLQHSLSLFVANELDSSQ